MSIHSREEENTFSCKECGAGFHREVIKRHIWKHKPEINLLFAMSVGSISPKWSYKEAGAGFSQIDILKNSTLTHTGAQSEGLPYKQLCNS